MSEINDTLQNQDPSDADAGCEQFSPSKGVVLGDVPGAPIDAYLEALSRVVSPLRITHISRTQEGVGVFLDSTALARDLVREDLQVQVRANGVLVGVGCRPYRLGCHRVLLSNCLPFLQDAAVLRELSKIGQVYPPIRSVPIQCKLPSFGHILSFTKTVTMAFKDASRVPRRILVPYRESTVPVYLSVDDQLDHAHNATGKSKSSRAPEPAPATNYDGKDIDDLFLAASKTVDRKLRQPVDAFLSRHPAAAALAQAQAQATATTLLAGAPENRRRHSLFSVRSGTGKSSANSTNTDAPSKSSLRKTIKAPTPKSSKVSFSSRPLFRAGALESAAVSRAGLGRGSES